MDSEKSQNNIYCFENYRNLPKRRTANALLPEFCFVDFAGWEYVFNLFAFSVVLVRWIDSSHANVPLYSLFVPAPNCYWESSYWVSMFSFVTFILGAIHLDVCELHPTHHPPPHTLSSGSEDQSNISCRKSSTVRRRAIRKQTYPTHCLSTRPRELYTCKALLAQ